MGCDGGTIPKRDELVRTKKKPEQVDKDAETVAKWKHCALSQNELKAPVVSCELGRLYNKDSVIEYLLDKTASNDVASHIRNMKDILELKFTANPAYKKSLADMGDEYIDRHAAEYICPVTAVEMSGRYRFVFSHLCGCVVSERALKEIKSNACHRCGQVYDEDDLIVINGTKDDIESLTMKMTKRRLQAKKNKKAKRESEKHCLDGGGCEMEAKKPKLDSPSSSSSKKKATATKKRASTGAPTSDFHRLAASESKLADSYSVAEDAGASEAFKSLFTSHKTCQNQQRAHWVTYNPLYN